MLMCVIAVSVYSLSNNIHKSKSVAALNNGTLAKMVYLSQYPGRGTR